MELNLVVLFRLLRTLPIYLQTLLLSCLNHRKAKAYIDSLIMQGLNFSQIALQLTKNDFTNIRGKQFQAVQVQRLATV